MASRKETIDAYFEGFRRGDHEAILALLTDDVAWDLPGHRHLRGKRAFDDEIDGGGSAGPPTLAVDRQVEEGETVVSIGSGEGARADGGTHRFAFCTVFTFDGDLISRVESYVVPLWAARP